MYILLLSCLNISSTCPAFFHYLQIYKYFYFFIFFLRLAQSLDDVQLIELLTHADASRWSQTFCCHLVAGTAYCECRFILSPSLLFPCSDNAYVGSGFGNFRQTGTDIISRPTGKTVVTQLPPVIRSHYQWSCEPLQFSCYSLTSTSVVVQNIQSSLKAQIKVNTHQFLCITCLLVCKGWLCHAMTHKVFQKMLF